MNKGGLSHVVSCLHESRVVHSTSEERRKSRMLLFVALSTTPPLAPPHPKFDTCRDFGSPSLLAAWGSKNPKAAASLPVVRAPLWAVSQSSESCRTNLGSRPRKMSHHAILKGLHVLDCVRTGSRRESVCSVGQPGANPRTARVDEAHRSTHGVGICWECFRSAPFPLSSWISIPKVM